MLLNFLACVAGSMEMLQVSDASQVMVLVAAVLVRGTGKHPGLAQCRIHPCNKAPPSTLQRLGLSVLASTRENKNKRKEISVEALLVVLNSPDRRLHCLWAAK